MDDNNQPTSPTPGGGVMDIQPPKTAPQVPGSDPAPEAEVGSVIAPATENPTSEPVTPTPPQTSEETPAELVPAPAAVQEAPKDTSPPADDTDKLQVPSDGNPMAITNQSPAKKKSGAPVVVIVVAVLVALGLCALVISIYMKSKNDSSTKNTTTSQTADNKITAAEVEKASTETDAALSQLDDAKDFADTDLTDQTLGL